jgi:hypothetical protein
MTYCVRHKESYLGWTLKESREECREIYQEKDPNGGWALIVGSAEIIPVTVIILEKGGITQ